MSMKRLSTVSVFPREYPATIPTIVPTTTVITVADSAMKSEIRDP
jgi:hypothetical protein